LLIKVSTSFYFTYIILQLFRGIIAVFVTTFSRKEKISIKIFYQLKGYYEQV